MLSACDLCGGEIGLDGRCTDCGSTNVGDEVLISPPIWGRLKIQYDFSGIHGKNLFEKLESEWGFLESQTQQKLFPKQSLNEVFTVGEINLIASEQAFNRVRTIFADAGNSTTEVVTFSPMSLAEIDVLRSKRRVQ